MNELAAILDGIDRLWSIGEEAAIATVVRVSGSAYRKPGARMLITPGGAERIGTVSGGCLEGDIARKAWQLTAGGAAAVLRYDSTDEDDGLWGLGLGCNGVIEILVERLRMGDPMVDLLRRSLVERREGVIATVFANTNERAIPLASRLLLDERGKIVADRANLAESIPQILLDAQRVKEQGRTMLGTYSRDGATIDALLEWVQPPMSLVIFGAGWDAIPLANAGKALGWRVIVVDRRAGHAKAERFASADEVIVCDPDETRARVPIDSRTAAVLMTHQYPDDLGYLKVLLQTQASYIGMLGPAKRRDRLLRDLKEVENFEPPAEDWARVKGPVGLDIGAENAPEIAAAIVAEILADRTGREGGVLSQRNAPIHDPLVHANGE
jgi:xanthine/CO dehydrogenase XdhC/CoxF family maturation factor